MAEAAPVSEPYILFELAGATYGLPSRLVQQVEMIESITPLPNAPPVVDGVVFVRGQTLPVLNLRARFGFPRIAPDLRARLLVVTWAGRRIGLVVDTAREFLLLPAEAIQPAPAAVSDLSGDYLAGVAALDNRLILLLNLDVVLEIGEVPVADPMPS
jgi:purine-binding chemotaxis protein CheW